MPTRRAAKAPRADRGRTRSGAAQEVSRDLDSATRIAHPSHPAARRRLARIAGHVQAIERMLADGRPCAEVVQQLKAVIAALVGVRTLLVGDHLHHCIADAIRDRRPAHRVVAELERLLSSAT